MQITSEVRPAIRIVHLAGELVNMDELVQAVTELDKAEERMVLDLGEVTFMDSSGLSGLVTIMSKRPIVLARPSAFVAELLKASKMDELFDVCPTLEDALLRTF